MSCQSESDRLGKFAGRLSSGISQLSSKQAFFTGLAVGVSGTGLGTMMIANRQRIANLFRREQQPRQALAIAGPAPSKGISRGKSSSAQTKKAIRSKPKPIPALASGKAAKTKPKPIPGIGKNGPTRPKPKPIPVLATTPTTLQATAIQLQTGAGKPYLAKKSYQVVGSDGADTGLAITPYLEQGDNKTVLKQGAWSVTHTGTGTLIDGPYDNLEQAQGLATKLSALPWSGSMSSANISQAKRMIKAYRQQQVPD